MKIFNIGVFVF